ncbi:hypothetical protein ACFQAV_09045 [Companilactobacillus huachuanensis]|uniref:Uncharacterized protein n=1 Tax=Companilactobacillus huachuanensis TaxID=2559914 RepID=A0ABW1RMA5_9LACO|nr:hypothetical protein [Companilactobacillus huachuanensis]
MKLYKSINFWIAIFFLLSISFIFPKGVTKLDVLNNLFNLLAIILFMLKARKDVTGKNLYMTFKWYKSLNLWIGVLFLLSITDIFFRKQVGLDWFNDFVSFAMGSFFIYLGYKEMRQIRN